MCMYVYFSLYVQVYACVVSMHTCQYYLWPLRSWFTWRWIRRRHRYVCMCTYVYMCHICIDTREFMCGMYAHMSILPVYVCMCMYVSMHICQYVTCGPCVPGSPGGPFRPSGPCIYEKESMHIHKLTCKAYLRKELVQLHTPIFTYIYIHTYRCMCT